jgi:hypothetical protein
MPGKTLAMESLEDSQSFRFAILTRKSFKKYYLKLKTID